MTDALTVLIVGSGDMGAAHARGYMSLEEASIVAVADPYQARAAALADACQVKKYYADCREAIQREQPDIVSVCVPAFLHAEIALYAMEQGCRVLCEKPIALTLEGAERMAEASERMPGRLGIVFQRRYLPVWIEAEKRLPLLGEPLSYQAADFRPIRPKRLMHSRSGNGGPVIDCCVHDFDMVLRLFGSLRSVNASGCILAQGKPELSGIQDLAVDTAAVSLRFDRGHTALLSYCWGLPTGFKDISRIEILGPEGMLRIGDGWLEHHMAGGRVETISGLDTRGHAAQIAAFVHAVRNGDALPVAPQEALQALCVAHEALNAIERGTLQCLE